MWRLVALPSGVCGGEATNLTPPSPVHILASVGRQILGRPNPDRLIASLDRAVTLGIAAPLRSARPRVDLRQVLSR